eukprot:1004950-Amphidinium_carterae.1
MSPLKQQSCVVWSPSLSQRLRYTSYLVVILRMHPRISVVGFSRLFFDKQGVVGMGSVSVRD